MAVCCCWRCQQSSGTKCPRIWVTAWCGLIMHVSPERRHPHLELGLSELQEHRAPLLLQDDVASCFEYYAGLAEKLDGRQWASVELGEEGYESRVLRQPLGAVALISPWNYPMLMAVVRPRLLDASGHPALASASVTTALGSCRASGFPTTRLRPAACIVVLLISEGVPRVTFLAFYC